MNRASKGKGREGREELPGLKKGSSKGLREKGHEGITKRESANTRRDGKGARKG